MGKEVNWAQKAEFLQKARDKPAARNPLKLSPGALKEQIEVIIDVLAGHIDDRPSASNINGNTSVAIEGLGTQPSHGVVVTENSKKGGRGVKGARSRTQSGLNAKGKALVSEDEPVLKSSRAGSKDEG